MKVLLISHNPISTYNNMGKTFSMLFAEFPKEELCQLYIYPSVPDLDMCSSYYRITDKDVLNSIRHFSKAYGTRITPQMDQHAQYELDADKHSYRNPKNKKAIRVLLRGMMWKCGNWYTQNLKEWMQEERPTHIFIAPGTGLFLYDIAQKLSQEYDLPIITYICDDDYFVEPGTGLFEKIKFHQLRRKIDMLMRKSRYLIAISEEAQETYTRQWDLPSMTVMTGSNYAAPLVQRRTEQPKKFIYMGNIRCNRYLSLAAIGAVLDQLNKTKGWDCHLDIYTSEEEETIIQSLQKCDTIRLCGYVSGEQYEQALQSADVLIHTEAFDAESIDRVKSSISTKIADLMASGIPVLAYGPEAVASIRYLKREAAAMVVTHEQALQMEIERMILDPEVRSRIVENACAAAKRNHDRRRNSLRIREVIDEI